MQEDRERKDSLFFILGPCVMESWELVDRVSDFLLELREKESYSIIFKSSYDKANRSSIHSFRGPGLKKGLKMLGRVKEKGLPVLSDCHSVEEIKKASEILDYIQIPAFLCRQTDLLVEAGRTGKWVNIKKGQFMSPWEMKNAIEKVKSTGNNKVMVTERGTTFGYNYLVNDFKGFMDMKDLGVPLVFDATHSVQRPGALGKASGGERRYVPGLAMSAICCGADGIFMEIHPDPDKALCDGPNMVPLDEVPGLLKTLSELKKFVESHKTTYEIRQDKGNGNIPS